MAKTAPRALRIAANVHPAAATVPAITARIAAHAKPIAANVPVAAAMVCATTVKTVAVVKPIAANVHPAAATISAKLAKPAAAAKPIAENALFVAMAFVMRPKRPRLVHPIAQTPIAWAAKRIVLIVRRYKSVKTALGRPQPVMHSARPPVRIRLWAAVILQPQVRMNANAARVPRLPRVLAISATTRVPAWQAMNVWR